MSTSVILMSVLCSIIFSRLQKLHHCVVNIVMPPAAGVYSVRSAMFVYSLSKFLVCGSDPSWVQLSVSGGGVYSILFVSEFLGDVLVR